MKTNDIYHTHLLLKQKKISSVELTKLALQNIATSNNNSFITTTEHLALKQALKADHSFAKNETCSFLQGIPYSLKDLFITKNIRTTAGSRALLNYIPSYQGTVAALLEHAQGVLLGKVGCDEFGMGSTNENTPFGTVTNPLQAEYLAGGSSGGSAASVAEGSAFFSIGTDTGGSIRLPANFCGLYGLKPSYGRISRYGQIAYGSSLDQASPIAKSTLDLACIFQELSRYDHKDSSMVPLPAANIVEPMVQLKSSYLKGKKLGVDESFINACEPDVQKVLHQAIAEFSKQGCDIKKINLPHLKYSVAVYYLIATSEASTNLARYDGIHYGFRADPHLAFDLEETYQVSRALSLGDEVKKRILLGTFALSSGYADEFFTKAAKVRQLIVDDFSHAFQAVDYIFSPVCATSALKKSQGNNEPVDAIKMYMNDLYTIPVNLAGLPSLAIPFGKVSSGLPTGFQIIGQQFRDEDLLLLGHAFELAQK